MYKIIFISNITNHLNEPLQIHFNEAIINIKCFVPFHLILESFDHQG